ncbi:MAG TPA: PIN domain-containing protein [Polyangia bacterium]|jgi:predicted nucleic acid-binding protein
MNDSVFVDTNVLVYARDASEKKKQPRAEAWMRALWRDRRGRVSIQVLQEFYATVTVKLRPGMPPEIARREVRSLMAWRPVVLDGGVVEGAWRVQDRLNFSWWDALIVAAAQRANCGYLLTEDLQDGQDLDGLVVVNPFLREPEAILS